jgi:uncharacterized phage protein gp47/JayE
MADEYITIPLSTDPDDLAASALDDLAQRIDGFVPQEGHLEVAMIEVLARLVAENRDVASRVPADIFRYAGQSLHGIPSTAAASAQVNSTWTAYDDLGHTIPAGTLVGYQLASDRQAFFRVVDQVTIAPGKTATSLGEVVLRAVAPGAAYNGIPPTAIQLADALSFVRSVVTTGTTSGGVDAETSSAYLDRLRQELRLMTPRPIHPQDFAVLARRISGVDRAVAIDGYNPVNGTYDNERMVAVALADQLGNPVPASVSAEVAAYLEDQREVNFVVRTIAPTYTTVDVDARLIAQAGFDVDVVAASASAALRAYLDPATWDFEEGVYHNELVSLLDQVPGVKRVDQVVKRIAGSSPVVDVVLAGVAPLVKAGSMSVSVQPS